jgi:hypothetical protein
VGELTIFAFSSFWIAEAYFTCSFTMRFFCLVLTLLLKGLAALTELFECFEELPDFRLGLVGRFKGVLEAH